MSTDIATIASNLARPFDPRWVRWRPISVSGNRAMALAYVDARTIQDRLDEVVGSLNWQDDYEIVAGGSVICRLRVRLDGEWITKVDVGSPSEQPDAGDKLKAAFSDALKRAAVKFGIGRYLYSLGRQWCDYDPRKKQFTKTPTLPAWALPAGQEATPPSTTPATLPAKQPPPAIKPATALPERPRSEDYDPSELINEEMRRYLFALGKAHGFSEQQINQATQQRYSGALVGQLTVVQWQDAIDRLEKHRRAS